MDAIKRFLQRAIDEAENGNEDFRVSLVTRSNKAQWFQISWDSLNFSYPSSEDPGSAIERVGISLPALVTLAEWKPGLYATFDHGADSPEVIASFCADFLQKVLGINPSELVADEPVTGVTGRT